jgi:galacturonokinase
MDDQGRPIESLRQELIESHGVTPAMVRLARVPYRVCPLGAHVDHQLGSSTVMALNLGLTLAYAPGPGGEVRLSSRDFPGAVQFSVDRPPDRRADDWGDFARGAAVVLNQRHPLTRGLVGIFSGRLQGGISSSAAAGVAALLALEDVNDLSLTAFENIELGRKIENEYLGLRNGLLDQAAVLQSRRDHLTRIDCRTASHDSIPAPPGLPAYRLLLAFSGLKKPLIGTDYNRRVEECAEAARDLLEAAGRAGAAPVLGNVTLDEYEDHKGRLRAEPGRRAAHFFAETGRVGQGVEAWRSGDLDRFGALMTASGESSIRLYECGTPPLIDLYHALIETDGVYGARFSGAGFRGCCVALVKAESAPDVAARISSTYAARHPELARHAMTVTCKTADGAAIESIPSRGRLDMFNDVYPLERVP